MAGLSEQSIDPKRTVVVLNVPSNVGEDELTIHFQKERNGGGDVDDVVLDGSVAFVTFDMSKVATTVLNHPEQVINGTKIDVQSYESWLTNKKKQERSSVVLKRSGGGDLCEGKERYKRLSATVARLKFVPSKDAQNVLTKAKKEHRFKGVSLNVIPYYDDFEELQEITTKITKTEFSYFYLIDPLVMDYIFNKEEIANTFDFKTMKYDKQTSRFHFTKDFDDSKLAQEFENKLKEFLHSFVKEEVKIPKAVFEKVKEAIEGKKAEFEAEKIDFSFDGYCVTFIGKKEDVTLQKRSAEAKIIDKILEKAKFETTELIIDDKNKLKFLNFIDYFKNVMTEFPGVKIHGMESSSGKLSLLGTAEKRINVQLKILQDLMKISEIDAKMSGRQIDFLKRTECQIVNNMLKKYDVMLMLLTIKGTVGVKAFQAKIMTLKKCDNTEEKRLLYIIHTKTSEKCIRVDEETACFLAKSNKLQEFKKEQVDQHQVLIDQELADPCNIWIVCEKSKMNNAEQELTNLTDEKKIASSKFRTMDPMKVRFLREHCWGKIKEKEHSCKAEGITVQEIDSDSLEVKGTQAGRKDMIFILEKLAGNVHFKAYPLTEPGMKKQMSMAATNVIISQIEKSHKCVVKKYMQPEETHEKTKGDGGASTMNLPYHSMSFVNDKEVKLASGHRITIVVGDLAQQKVDVIVNTTNDKVDLNANSCGKALLKVAGKELLSECQKIGSLKKGDMASTGPAKLNCKRVYHVRASPWDNGKGATILGTLIKKCLDQMEKDKLRSIAIPAIGTGNLHCPRPDVTKILFEEVTGYFTDHPQSLIGEVHFVAFGGDQATIDAFIDALQELRIKSVILSLLFRNKVVPNAGSQSNVTFTEKHDGSLELSLGSRNLTVQIVCDDISKEKTDLIMHVIGQDFSVKGGVAKALIKAGGDSIIQECKALGKPSLYSTQYSNAGRLAVPQIAHVIAPSSMKVADLKKCLDTFFDDVSKKFNIARVSFSAIGAGAMGYSERQSADLIFDSLSRIAKSKNHALSLIRIVIFEKAKFIKFKDATKVYFSSGGATSSSPQPADACASHFIKPAKSVGGDEGTSIRIYSDDRGKIDKAWGELRRKISQNIDEKIINNDVVRNFTDRDLEKLLVLERDNDVKIKVDKSKGMVTIKGYIVDVANVQGRIGKILKDIKDNESKVPVYWDSSLTEKKFNQINLSTSSKEYKDVETAFHKTASNHIVRIERIQNKEIYGLYNLKRQAMMKKYDSNFADKELMLFHGTSVANIEKINAGGLNRNFAGQHAAAYGKGVYFARDARYSCHTTLSPPDSHGLRYMYYARVLVGDYTKGNSSMLVPPNKNTADTYETYDSVVDNPANPTIYVMFQDYEYYTEYLITFK